MSGPQSGGGSSSTSTTTSGLPEWALPYAQDTLAKQSALSDVAYQPYGGDRIQGFTPMQETARQNAAGMGTSGITGQVAQRGLNTNYQPGQMGYQQVNAPNLQNYQMGPAQQVSTQSFNGQGTADQYMNPYMQNVVDIQKREAQRQSGIQGTQQAGQATSSGALGGSRDAIMRAERERNLGQQMGDIQAQGSNAAFQQAQQQFNAEQNRGLQAQQANQQAGLTTGIQNLASSLGTQQLGAGQNMQAQLANQGAGLTSQQQQEQSRQFGSNLGLQGLQLAGTAGAQQFQQGMDVNKLQAAYGAQQQGMGQRGLDMAYQDFLNQKAYPQTQLSNMANMMRGLPIQQQTTTGTPGSPSNLQTLGGLAQIGYGLSGFFADGGEVSSYAGGGSVDSEQNIESIVRRLSDQQLAQAEQAAKARGDIVQMQVINMEKAARASMKRGIAAAPVDMDQMLPTEESMARGGIVAFGFGGSAYGEGDEGEDEAQDYMRKPKTEAEDMGGGGGDDEDPKDIAGSISALQKLKYKAPTPEERAAEFKANKARLLEGVDTTDRDATRADIKRMQEESDADLKRGKSLALIQSGAAMFEGNDFARAAGKSASAFGQAYGDAIKANQAKKQALQNMRLNLAESQRKEQMGLNRDAIALQDQARKDGDAAQRFEVDRTKALGVLYGQKTRAERVPAVKPPTPPKVAEATLQAAVDDRMAREKPLAGETEAQQRNRLTAQEGPKILAQLGTRIGAMTSDVGPTKAGLTNAGLDLEAVKAAEGMAEKRIDKLPVLNKEYRTASPERKAEIELEVKNKARASFNLPPLGGGKAAPATPAKAVPASQIPAGTTFGKVVPGKGTEVLKNGKVIGYAN